MSPSISRVVSRSTALSKPFYRPRVGQIAAFNARKFTATSRRPFLDECLVQTHNLISGVHDMTGLPWAATIPLVAFLVKIVILTPIELYGWRVSQRRREIDHQIEESRPAIEREIEQRHRDKSPSELQKIQKAFFYNAQRKMIKQTGAQLWRTLTIYVRFPIWFAVMETIRRMTGVEDGMPSLAAKSLTALKGKQNTESGTMDQLIPMEPSLATEGMLWFDDLMIPDPSLILPFVLSGIIFMMFSTGRGITGLHGSGPNIARVVHSWNLWKGRHLKLAALAVGPVTLMFPSAMLLYWISNSLAAVIVQGLVGLLLRIRIVIHVPRAPGKDKPGEAKPKSESKPKMQIYRGPTMKDLQNQKRKKK